MLGKGFGVDKAARDLYKWAREYSPPPMSVQISNYAAIAGILCIGASIYLGATNAPANVKPVPTDLGGWLTAVPQMAGYFIKSGMDIMVVGIGTILFGRSIRLYFERDVRMLRNAALIVSVAWSRWILDGTADILISPQAGYEKLAFSIVVGILIGIASVLVIFLIHRSSKDFFEKSKAKVDELEER